MQENTQEHRQETSQSINSRQANQGSTDQLLTSLITLVRSEGSVKQFWNRYLQLITSLCSGRQALLVAESGGKWHQLSGWSPYSSPWTLNESLQQLAARALSDGLAAVGLTARPTAGPTAGPEAGDVAEEHISTQVLAFRADVGSQEIPPVILIELEGGRLTVDRSTLVFVAALPSFFQLSRQYRQTREDIVFFAEMMKLTGTVGADDSFRLAAMRLCNETAGLFGCSQVSLGWADGNEVKVRAISHLDSFENSAGEVWEMESAMEECLDQDAEILFPQPDAKSRLITRAHQAYSEIRRCDNLLTLPIRSRSNAPGEHGQVSSASPDAGESELVGVFMLERAGRPFSVEEIWRLRLLLEQCSHWLAELEERSRWLGSRMVRKLRRRLAATSSGWRAGAIAVLILIGLLFLRIWPHSVEGTCILKADDSLSVTAPVDGYLQTVAVAPGELVEKDALLVDFDSRELLTEQSAALAKLARYYREAEKAKAMNSLAEMQIALLMARETEADLQRIAYSLENVRIVAPFVGVVVEGDLRSRIGAPVRQGEVLMQVAALNRLSVRISIPENRIDEFSPDNSAELVLVARPDLRYPVRVDTVIPVATVENGQNVFHIDASHKEGVDEWWRPGMSGLVRIEAGYRSLWWLLSRDIVDYLRLKFWL